MAYVTTFVCIICVHNLESEQNEIYTELNNIRLYDTLGRRIYVYVM